MAMQKEVPGIEFVSPVIDSPAEAAVIRLALVAYRQSQLRQAQKYESGSPVRVALEMEMLKLIHLINRFGG